MNKQRKIDIQRTILELEKPYPKDDLILSYSDFLTVRDYLCYYQFNPIVFSNLIHLLNNEWKAKTRINRLSMLQKIKQYYRGTQKGAARYYFSIKVISNHQLSMDTRKMIFELFKKVFEESEYISERQIDEARKICNNLLIDIELTPTEEEWLCSNAANDDLILNRVLRYPVKSEIISNWARSNFKNDILRSRRAELLSWIIDQEPTFEIEQQILIDDFEYLNKNDIQAVQNYSDEIAANLKAIQDHEDEIEFDKIIERDLGVSLAQNSDLDFFDNFFPESEFTLPDPELKLSKRPYGIPIDDSKDYPKMVPDFKMLREEFYINLPTFHKATMIWAIGYSRLDNALKYELLKKYYNNETYHSMYKVCKRTKNIELLKWILEQQ